MTGNSDGAELKRRLAQAKRHADNSLDSVTKERLQALVVDIEQQLAEAKARNGEPGG